MNSSSLKEIFDCTIVPEVNEILDNNYGLFFMNNAFDLFYNEYITLHDYYSKKYMNKNSDGLDTHKEIATIVIALLKAKLIKTLNSDYYGSECNRYSFNEQLAFKVSCDLLKSILVCDYKKDENLDANEKEYSINSLDCNGILFPKVSYQSYDENTITEFYYTSREGNYNILCLADKYFWLEDFNKRYIHQSFLKDTGVLIKKTN